MADMNNVSLTGRLTKDVELKYTKGEKAYAKFSIAVNRTKKDEVDFINLLAWEKTAELCSEYLKKGNRVGIIGHIQIGSYENEGKKVNTFDVVVDKITFLESAKEHSEEKKSKSNKIQFDDNLNADDEFPF